jgi:ribosomal protein S18 acetylase RimI-like enzyme
MSGNVRLAHVGDAAGIARLVTPLGYPTTAASVTRMWAEWTAEGNLALVVDGPDGLLGMITLHHMLVLHRPKRVGRITALAVDSSARGQGHGRALMRAGEDALQRVGCGMVEVTSHARRMAAHEFYRRMGYEQTSLRFARDLAEPAAP